MRYYGQWMRDEAEKRIWPKSLPESQSHSRNGTGSAGWAKLYRVANPMFTCVGVALVPMAFAFSLRSNLTADEMYITIIVIAEISGIRLVAHAWTTGTVLGWFRAFYGKVGFWYIGTFSSFVLLRGMPGRIRVGAFAEADRGAWFMLFRRRLRIVHRYICFRCG